MKIKKNIVHERHERREQIQKIKSELNLFFCVLTERTGAWICSLIGYVFFVSFASFVDSLFLTLSRFKLMALANNYARIILWKKKGF